MKKYTTKIIAFEKNDADHDLEKIVAQIEIEGLEIVSHSRSLGSIYNEDIFILKLPTRDQNS